MVTRLIVDLVLEMEIVYAHEGVVVVLHYKVPYQEDTLTRNRRMVLRRGLENKILQH